MSSWATTLELLKSKKHLFLNEFDRNVRNLTSSGTYAGKETEVFQRKNEFIRLLDYLIEADHASLHLLSIRSEESPPEPNEVRLWLGIILTVLRPLWQQEEIESTDQEIRVLRLAETVYLYAWRRHEEQLSRRFQLQEQKLMAGIVAAQENERKRLARDIHDEVIQLLASSILRLQIIQHAGPGHEGQDLKDLYFEIREIEQLIRESVQAYRLVSVDMDSFWLNQAGFFPTLRAYIRSYETKTGIKARLKIEGEEYGLERTVGIAIFRVIQEALQNVRKHAQATTATVEIELNSQDAYLLIADNGKGFDLDLVKTKDFRTVSCISYFGLFSMEQRIKLLGGVFEISSKPGEGTRINVKAPSQGAKLPDSKQVKRGSPWIKLKY
ncbi:two-component sensor histidine kinase DegS [Paradesulfitobacterium aromaticivorans]